METDIIVILINAVIIGWLIVTLLLAAIKGVPLAAETTGKIKDVVLTIVPVLRRLFDPNTALSKALEAKGFPRELADKISEQTADTLMFLLNPPPSEGAKSVPHGKPWPEG